MHNKPTLLLDDNDVQVLGPNGRKLTLGDDCFYCEECGYACPIGQVRDAIRRSIESLKTLRSAL